MMNGMSRREYVLHLRSFGASAKEISNIVNLTEAQINSILKDNLKAVTKLYTIDTVMRTVTPKPYRRRVRRSRPDIARKFDEAYRYWRGHGASVGDAIEFAVKAI